SALDHRSRSSRGRHRVPDPMEVAVAGARPLALALIAGCAAHAPRPESCAVGDERCMALAIDREQMDRRFEYDDPALARYIASVGERLPPPPGAPPPGACA